MQTSTEAIRAFDTGSEPGADAHHGHCDIELVDADEACRILGGSRPLNRATLYRAVASGRFPRPIKVGMSSRWVKAELFAVLKALIADRDGTGKAA